MLKQPLELTCHACDVILQAETEQDLIDLGQQHARSMHGHEPPRDQVLARIRLQNR